MYACTNQLLRNQKQTCNGVPFLNPLRTGTYPYTDTQLTTIPFFGIKILRLLLRFLPHDAMHKRGLRCHAVSVCPSVRHVRGSRQNE